jgi:hypothetical protein
MGEILRGTKCKLFEGYNDIVTVAPWMIDYFQNGEEEAKLYVPGSSKRAYFKCPDCGKIKSKPLAISDLNRKHSIGCKCKDNKSYPEKFMSEVLEQLNFNYIWGYSPNWLRGYRGSKQPAQFDFFL